ncbi:PUA-like superfamily [Sesbania bispinosa]|nr:PUA-like superfamily [Sesbania bispinosa]
MEKKSGDDDENGNGCSPPVKLSDCLEELVKFTLYSHSLLNLHNLSTQFCSTLLKDDPTHPSSSHQHPHDSLEGVPQYPLYKRLASALLRCMESETFCSAGCNLAMTHEFEKSSMQQKHHEWHKLIVEKLSEIENIFKSVSFELHVQEPYFTQLKDGLKTVEGRCASGKYNRIELGNLLLLNKSVVFEVQGVRWYPSFFDMLEAESLEKVLPGVESVEEGVKVYRRFYTEEKEQANGVLAIIVSKLAIQPYISLASLLSGLSNEGVQGLLGLVHTTGTIPNALPPPRSTLLASFNLPYNPNESSLTDGARALAKHACRSSSGYWGSLDGNDSNKNRLAMNVINQLEHCCWLNIHIVPPHGVVFEIRVANGYGARWTEDGSKSPTWKMVTQRDGSTSSASQTTTTTPL